MKESERQTERETGRQAGRQTDIQIDRHKISIHHGYWREKIERERGI
jgi:hypothetical protein